MPVLPTVDFSPISQAIGARGAAGQANYSEEFARLKDKEEKRQEVVGAIQGAFEIASSVYGILEQSKMETGKREAIEFDAKYKKAVEESILNGSSTVDEVDGQKVLKLDPSLESMFADEEKRIGEAYKGFGRVQNWMKTTATQSKANSSAWANQVLLDRGMKEAADAFNQNLDTAMKTAIGRQDIAPVYDTIQANSRLGPDGKAALFAKAQKAYGLGVAQERAMSATRTGGLSAGLADIDATDFAEEDKAALRATVAKTVQTAEAQATDAAGQAYEAAKQNEGFTADTAIKGIVQQYPEWMRPTVEAGLRKQQARDNLSTYGQQFNQDRDNPSLSTLKKHYEAIQSSGDFAGDEGTRSTVMSWYEGLISGLSAEGTGVGKAANEAALSTLDSMINLWTSGAGGMTGYQVLGAIDEYKNAGQVSATQANTYRDRVIKHQFPQAAEFLDKKTAYAKGLLGLGKKADKDLTPDQLTRVNVLASTMSEKLGDMLMEEGGTVTAARVGELFEQVKGVAAAKALDDIRVGWSLFQSRESMTEAAVAKTKAAIDSPAGRAAVFQDVSGKVNFLSDTPNQFRDTLEKAAQWETETLAARGIQVASAAFEQEGLYDITGSKVYTGTDGMQYRFMAEGGKMVPYTRGTPGAAWAKLPAPAPRPAAPAAAPTPPPAQAQEDATRQKQVTSQFAPELEKLPSDAARAARMVELISLGTATWDDFSLAGYNKNGSKKK